MLVKLQLLCMLPGIDSMLKKGAFEETIRKAYLVPYLLVEVLDSLSRIFCSFRVWCFENLLLGSLVVKVVGNQVEIESFCRLVFDIVLILDLGVE